MKHDVFELSLEPCWRDDARRAYSTILEMGDRIRTITEREVDELLSGAIDMHVHAFPDPEIDTGWDQINVARRANRRRHGRRSVQGPHLSYSHDRSVGATGGRRIRPIDRQAAPPRSTAASC